MRSLPRILAFALFLAGCGGNVVVDGTPSGTGGSSSTMTTGTTGTTGTTTVTTISSDGCPTLAPNTGDPCDTPGLTCDVPSICCGGTTTCQGGVWITSAVECGQPCLICPGTTFGCSALGVCVTGSAGGHCAENPCNGAPPDCGCAGSLCGTAGCIGPAGGDTMTLQCH